MKLLNTDMLIGGLQKFTALDYPDKLAATVFTVGCNFRCPFCHNEEIVRGKGANFLDEAEVLEFLKGRRGELDGVCITGGEPTMQKDLPEFMRKVKEMGFLVKLDTNGSNYAMVERIMGEKLADYFAIDIKTAFSKYHLVRAPQGGPEEILRSLRLIVAGDVPLELRTTVVPRIVTAEDFDDIVRKLGADRANILPRLYRYGVQAFRPQKCLDKEFESLDPYGNEVLEEIAEKLRTQCPRVDVIK